MAEMEIPRDGVTLLIQHLIDIGLGVPVTGRRVSAPRGRAIQVRSTGGTRPFRGCWRHQLTVTVWGAGEDDETATDNLAGDVEAHVMHLDILGMLSGKVPCRNVILINHVYPDPDPTTRRYRATFTFTVDIRSAT